MSDHPDDIAQQAASEREAATAIDTWLEKHKDELKQTIQTYADVDAEDQWWALRELFWGSSPTGSDSLLPKRKRKTMTPIDRERLRAAALAAMDGAAERAGVNPAAVLQAFISAARPSVVIGLLDENERLREFAVGRVLAALRGVGSGK